jgi:hypothetical protein
VHATHDIHGGKQNRNKNAFCHEWRIRFLAGFIDDNKETADEHQEHERGKQPVFELRRRAGNIKKQKHHFASLHSRM